MRWLRRSIYRDGHGERRMPERSFKAGDKIPTTGVYKTVHAGQHIPTHYVTAFVRRYISAVPGLLRQRPV